MANGAILGQSTTTWTNDQILSSVSAALYSLGANATPDQVFAAIRPLITTAQNTANNAKSAANTAQQTANNAINDAEDAQNTANNALSVANGKAKITTGSYVGSGEFGVDNPNSLTLPFVPKFMAISGESPFGQYVFVFFFCLSLTSSYKVAGYWGEISNEFTINDRSLAKLEGSTISWYFTTQADYQLNENGITYNYWAIG